MNRQTLCFAVPMVAGLLAIWTPAASGQENSKPSKLPGSMSWTSKDVTIPPLSAGSQSGSAVDLPVLPPSESAAKSATQAPTAPKSRLLPALPRRTATKNPAPSQQKAVTVYRPAPQVMTPSGQPGKTFVYPTRPPINRYHYYDQQQQPPKAGTSSRRLFNGAVFRRIRSFFVGDDEPEPKNSRNPYDMKNFPKYNNQTAEPPVNWKNNVPVTTTEPPVINNKNVTPVPVNPRPANPVVAVPPTTTTKVPVSRLRPQVIKAVGPNVRVLKFEVNRQGKLDIKLQARTQKEVDQAFDRMYQVPGVSVYELGEIFLESTSPQPQPGTVRSR